MYGMHVSPQHETFEVEECGLFVSPKYPTLGASPDGIFHVTAVVLELWKLSAHIVQETSLLKLQLSIIS